MSNYPPGVTGHEYAIAGGSEFDAEHEVNECRKLDGVNIVQIAKRGGSPYPAGTFTGPSAKKIVRRAKGFPCTFVGGEVEGVVLDHASFIWECPVCGAENETDVTTHYEED